MCVEILTLIAVALYMMDTIKLGITVDMWKVQLYCRVSKYLERLGFLILYANLRLKSLNIHDM